MAIDENKQKALAAALGQIEKQFGKGSIMRLGEDRTMDVETISTGSLSLDIALGAGGLPMGRIVEIYGPESSGKTTLTLQVIAAAQRAGKTCAFIDAEHALDPVYARKLGVDIDNLLCSQPDTGEQALEICDALARSGAVDVLVVDSVAALTPKAEIEPLPQPGLRHHRRHNIHHKNHCWQRQGHPQLLRQRSRRTQPRHKSHLRPNGTSRRVHGRSHENEARPLEPFKDVMRVEDVPEKALCGRDDVDFGVLVLGSGIL